jgi:hypothetical protein
VRFFALVAWLSAWAGGAAAQQTVDSASLSGRVTDPSGAVVPGAAVAARHVDTVTRSVTTDEDGRFRFPYLQVGTYEIKVVQPGFREVTRVVTLTVAAAVDLPVLLRSAASMPSSRSRHKRRASKPPEARSPEQRCRRRSVIFP